MKLYRLIKIFPVIITLVLFLIPFFWLKPGEMDLGGDSTRLYFYQPWLYLKAHLLYNVIPSGIGGDSMSYFAIPYVLVLGVLRFLFSPTILIGISNGLKLSVGFLAIFFIVRELLLHERNSIDKRIVEFSAIASGLFYVFSPIMVNSGWDRAILTHTQIFIYPLIFFLLLRYVISNRFIYIMGALIISVLFSFNFSFFGAPGFFSFFPLSLLFLFIYSIRILHAGLPWRGFIAGLVLFILLQAFHIIPHILSLVLFKSQYGSVFSEEGSITRGLDYFTGIAPNIKVSISLLNLAQVRAIAWTSLGSVLFPLILILGLISNRKIKKEWKYQTVILTSFFFMITLFFVTANITFVGFNFYKALFYIPGFKMFRNFYGQWSMVYVFFYALFIGQCLAIAISELRNKLRILLPILFIVILLPGAYPLLNGSMVNDVHYKSKSIKQNVNISPAVESLIDKIRQLPIDGKILSLPLSGPGYQVIAGGNGGVYIGPSMFSYLSGKNDFPGYDGLAPYGQGFIEAVQNNDFNTVNRLISLLNIKYIFYNSDPYIYDDNFPSFPYDYVRDYMPKTQQGYGELVKKLPVNDSKKEILGQTYFLFPVKDEYYSPHIYPTTDFLYTTFPDTFLLNKFFSTTIRPAVFHIDDAQDVNANTVLEAEYDNPFIMLKNNLHLHKHEPYVSVKPSAPSYPFVLLKERFDLWRARKNHVRFVDFSFLFLAKRITELERFGDSMPLFSIQNPNPILQRLSSLDQFDSWQVSFDRYEKQMVRFMDWIRDKDREYAQLEEDKIKTKEQLDQHRRRLLRIIKMSNKSFADITYLRQTAEEMFERLYDRLDIGIYDPGLISYNLNLPAPLVGTYDIFAEFSNVSSNVKSIQLTVNNENIIHPLQAAEGDDGSLVRLGNVRLTDSGTNKITMHVGQKNLIDNTDWINSGFITKSNGIDSITLNNISNDYIDGLVEKIPDWEPLKQYIITFDYNTYGKYVTFRAFDKKLVDEKTQQIKTNQLFEKVLYSTSWQTFQSLVSATQFSKEAYLQILKDTDDKIEQIDIRNLSVVPINYPRLFFKKQNAATLEPEKTPEIVFQKINPTRYSVEVTNAVNPYVLVFSEAYNNQWKLIDVSRKQEGKLSTLMNALGTFISRLPMVHNNNAASQNISAEYFNGMVKEGNNINSFLDQRNFTSWGKKTVAEKGHVKVNGYANAWIIKPEDVENRSSYTLILEMATQNHFYIFAVISTITTVGIGLYFIFKFLRKFKRNTTI